MNYDGPRALELLRLGISQPDAAFRRGQEEAVRHVVEGRGRLLVVQRTGWGKSFVYFIAVKLLREAGMGPALLVSPLLALMRNQIAAAARMGVRAATINSDNKEVWERVEGAVLRDEVDILLISPERLGNQRFVERVLAAVGDRISLLVIDEAHCISDWGHDFRPDYRRIGRIVEALPPNLRLLATTATANDRVVEAYTGESGDRRPALEQALLDNEVKALVATTALGMGFDKPDLAFVIHYQAPGSVVAYYQQMGRAGRALESAHGVLLGGEEDTDITDFFINTAFPERWRVDEVIAALEAAPDGLTEAQILAQVNIRQGRLKQLLKILSLEAPAPVVKEGQKLHMPGVQVDILLHLLLFSGTGRALCHWKDAGWGRLVRRGKYEEGRFADELVEACVELLRNWNQEPAPQWVTFIPSLRHPELMPDFAERLAVAAGLPFRSLLVKVEDRPEQKTMENSAQQAANVWGSLEVDGRPPAEPVLLVDDIVDSRWTFTVAAWVLRNEGSGEVWPLALAQA